jgi:hypothetical protein
MHSSWQWWRNSRCKNAKRWRLMKTIKQNETLKVCCVHTSGVTYCSVTVLLSHVMCQKCEGTNERTNLFFLTFCKTMSMFPLWSALFVGFVFSFFSCGGSHQEVHLSFSLCWVLCFIDVWQVFIIILEAN